MRSRCQRLGAEAAIHNHFLASLVNLGLVAAVVTTVVLFVQPLARLVRRGLLRDRERVAVFAAALGAITSLSFYEGFFSPSLMLVWALLIAAAFSESPGDPAPR